MTEQEAKTKWCPFVRQTSETDNYKPATNRFEVADASAFNCIGSACMAWRTNEKPDTIKQGIAIYSGFCGLAGRA